MVTGEIDDEHGDPFETGFGLFCCPGCGPVVDVGVVGDRRCNELVSLISVRSSSFSLSLFSSELLSVSAASMDFLCMPEKLEMSLLNHNRRFFFDKRF
jgi:hypothetical protein